MSTFESIEAARAYFEGDRFAAENGMVIDDFGEGWASCSMVITDRHMNANGGVMGGAIFTLADFANAVASNHLHRPTVAMQMSVNFMSGTRGTKLTAVARCVKDGRTTSIFEIKVTDDLNRDVALIVATDYKC